MSGRFVKGVSGNPKGRPRTGESVAEVLRAQMTPIEFAGKLIALIDTAKDERVRLAALIEYGVRAYPKPKAPEAPPEMTDEEYAVECEEIARETLLALPTEQRLRLIADPAPTDTIQ